LLVVFLCDLSQIWRMAEKNHRDAWDTGSREGYEDRGAFRAPRPRQKEPGSPLLRIMGAIAIVGGICWGVYLFTSNGGGMAALQQNNYGPVAIVGLGVVCSIVGKYLRA
jgi:hypothetical protein